MDTQIVELLGRNRLIAEILRAELEVALPIRDRGVDLVVYADLAARGQNFISRPIQMKSYSERGFRVDRKYEKIRDLLIAYVWHVHDFSKTVTYVCSVDESVTIANTMGWTKTPSWEKGQSWTTTSPGKKLIGLLEPFRMTTEKWRQIILGKQ
jgi:hypothetical protein